MARDVVIGLPEFASDYTLALIDADTLNAAVKPKQFLHIDQEDCILCEGCVDICPWRCIHMLDAGCIAEAEGVERPGSDPSDHVVFVVDEEVCTRCALCVDRCPTGVIVLGKAGPAAQTGDPHWRDHKLGYVYGMRL